MRLPPRWLHSGIVPLFLVATAALGAAWDVGLPPQLAEARRFLSLPPALLGLAAAAPAAPADVPQLPVPAADAPASPVEPPPAAPAPAPAPLPDLPARQIDVPAAADHPAYTVFAPAGPATPRRVVLALHGINSNGPDIAATILEPARAQGWVVVAPTIRYGDWTDPTQLAAEELRLQPQLATVLERVTEESGVPVAGKALVFGFSRGAQAAMRLAIFYPDRVEAVAAFSAGTYTLPSTLVRTLSGATIRANLPFGVADLEARRGAGMDLDALHRVRILIGVAAGDARENEVPRQWDIFVGRTRVERARNYAAALQSQGLAAQLSVVPGSVHTVLPQMPEQAVAFFTAAA